MAFFSFHGKSVKSTLLAHVLDPDKEFLFRMEGAMSLSGEVAAILEVCPQAEGVIG